MARGGFSPHRHDTYTVALTLHGVQSFNYRRELRHSLPGKALILHPDEVHDGLCSDDAGFSYCAAYIPPSDVSMIVGGGPLPFLEGGISGDVRLVGAVARLIECCGAGAGRLAYDDALFDLVGAMQTGAPRVRSMASVNREAVMRVRQFLDGAPRTGASLADMEKIAGYDRWQLSRDFRRLVGTSPHRYLQCRRVDRAIELLRRGDSLASAAHDAGFADQSHFGREFRKTLGMTPQSWRKAERARTIVL